MKYKYLIVDDEPLARKLLHTHASKIELLEEVGVCASAVEALNFLLKQSVDLIFLDIQMPELTGRDFIKSLRQPPSIILTTAHREYAAEAFEWDVIDYLVKPISFERFLKSVDKFMAIRHTATPLPIPQPLDVDATIYIKADRKIFQVSLSTLAYVESLDNYVKVYLADKVLVTHETITSLAQRLPSTFVRIHRSFIVNSRLIQSVSSEGVFIHNKELPFGRAFKQSAIARMGLEHH